MTTWIFRSSDETYIVTSDRWVDARDLAARYLGRDGLTHSVVSASVGRILDDDAEIRYTGHAAGGQWATHKLAQRSKNTDTYWKMAAMDKHVRRHGFYSYSAALEFGHCLYRTEDGKVVKITEVVELGTNPSSKWEDICYVGIVTDCVQPNMFWAKEEADMRANPYDYAQRLLNKIKRRQRETSYGPN